MGGTVLLIELVAGIGAGRRARRMRVEHDAAGRIADVPFGALYDIGRRRLDHLRVEREGANPQRALRTRYLVHAAVALTFALCIAIFHLAGSGTIIDTIYRLAGYTYGPLLGLFSFGLFTRRRVVDGAVPYVAVFSPVLCVLLDYLAPILWNYHFSYELLLLNAALTFLGLLLNSKTAARV